MTFSEYIKLHAATAYREFCKQNKILPIIDIEVKERNLCALVKPKLDKTVKKQYN